MPRVLIITDVTGPGGVGTHIGQLVLVGQRLGWEVLVVMEEAPQCDPMAHSLTSLGVPVRRASLYRKFHSEEKITEAVLKAFADHRPDVVHVQCGSPRSAILPRELTIKSCIPLIVTENFVAPDVEISEALLGRIREIYQRTFTVIAVCEENRSLLTDKFKLHCPRIVVIKYGVELPLAPVPRKPAFNLKALTVTRLSPRKGVDVFIHAIAALPDDVRARFHFTVTGSGEDEGLLKQLVADLSISDYITFAGWCFDVPKLLREHDLFILPSLAEGQPIALLEALAAGLPCIASAASGIPEALGDGEYGALVAPGDPAALGAEIRCFAKDQSILLEKAKSAGPYLRRHHDLFRNMKAIIELWRSAAEQNRAIPMKGQ